MSRRSDMHGFTLVELMVAIAVLAIFIAIAVPSFGRLIENNRVTATANEFHSLLISARSDAVTKRTSIAVTQGNGIWSSGERTIEIPASVNVAPSVTSITFNPNGTATASSTTFTNSDDSLSFTVSTQTAGFVRKVQD
ncbi:pilus assembly FimT family protein [Pseudomonas saudiphocaensis]|uniref:Type II secretion system protein H n=1 Tax=Pseudomonas saudiphocaensis TaxID=1499686 RepID=A0A078LZH8_9PSED|nr:GspH/FimT family pseudopilin [Pseudomonas saudiphocaensis]MBE7929127.1 GspH/FimT family pseudopilin [Pseudomonas saudiphocaensis]CDZ95752.1 Tfp pilus assembly protein FimT-like protein [Pseudomonas saudiphocaensis]